MQQSYMIPEYVASADGQRNSFPEHN